MNPSDSLKIQLGSLRSYDKQNLPYQSMDGLSDGVRKTDKRVVLMNLPDDFRGRSVLDLGCNTGAFCFEAKKRNAGKVVGLEFSLRPLLIAQQINLDKNLNIQFHKLNLNDGVLNLASEIGAYKFDYLFALSIWKHVYDKVFWSIIKAFTKRACWIELSAVHDGRHYGEDLKMFLRKNRNNVEEIRKLLLEKSGAKDVKFLCNTNDQGKRGCYLIIYDVEDEILLR
jgi:SAM-dependent methyltransferase